MKEEKLKELVLFLIAIILIVIIVKYLNVINFIRKLFLILIPVFVGFIYAWMFNPIIRKLSRKCSRNIVCIGVFLIFVLILVMFLYFLIPVFYQEIIELLNILPSLFSVVEKKVNNLGLQGYLDNVLKFLINNVPSYLINFVSDLVKYIGVIGIGLILGLYISMDYEKVVSKFCFLVPKKYKCGIINVVIEASDEVRKCVNGILLVAFCVFIMDSVLFLIIGLDAPLLFGMLCGITDLIPYIGPYIGGIVAVMVGFTESDFLGILTIIVCFIVQAVENYVLQPFVMSKSIKISPVLIIIGLLIFGNLFGVIGMIIAMPAVAVIKVLMEHIIKVKEKCK